MSKKWFYRKCTGIVVIVRIRMEVCIVSGIRVDHVQWLPMGLDAHKSFRTWSYSGHKWRKSIPGIKGLLRYKTFWCILALVSGLSIDDHPNAYAIELVTDTSSQKQVTEIREKEVQSKSRGCHNRGKLTMQGALMVTLETAL